ncbi:MAG: ANTAR domain-containing protein [Nocardioidaceae bacterium]|jgi:response regulator NasT
MSEYGLTEPEAFRWIRRGAMDRRTTMKVVAMTEILTSSDRA